MQLTEPLRWKNVLYFLNNRVFDSAILTQIVPITADVFVFAYPVILVIRYIVGIIKHKTQYKSDSLLVLLSVVYVIIINLWLQQILDKARPIFAWDNSIHLILQELPSASFPSDHAAVSMVIALMIYRVGRHRNLKHLKSLWIVLVVIAVIMSVSRIAVWVHRPTDILAGWGVAVIVMNIITVPSIRKAQKHYIIKPLIRVQEWLLNLVWYPWK